MPKISIPLINILSPFNRGGTAPVNTVANSISGSTTVGSVLTTTDGTFTGTAPITYDYQWKRGATNVGTNASTYTTVNADIGENMTCTVTATNAFGSDTATSNTIVVVAQTLIATMDYEWYFQNVLNASANIITIPDTGSVGGMDISNPALANKPTASSIGGKESRAADAVDDYLYKATSNFMRSMPTWMVTIVFKYDSSGVQRLFSIMNEASANLNGMQITYNNSLGVFTLVKYNGTTTLIPMNTAQALVNGTNYIFTFSWDGTNLRLYNQTTQVFTAVESNPLAYPTATANISTMAIIGGTAGNFFGKGNIGYVGVDENNLTRMNNNVATLKTTFSI